LSKRICEHVFFKAGKFLAKAKKFSGKFDVFALRHFMLDPERVMNTCLQVKTGSMHNLSAFIHDLQKSDHVKFFD